VFPADEEALAESALDEYAVQTALGRRGSHHAAPLAVQPRL